MKVPRGAKAGVLPCVLWFKELAERAESIVMGTDRRADLDKAYQTLTDALFKTIDRVATEHQKTPSDVIKFGGLPLATSALTTYTHTTHLTPIYTHLTPTYTHTHHTPHTHIHTPHRELPHSRGYPL